MAAEVATKPVPSVIKSPADGAANAQNSLLSPTPPLGDDSVVVQGDFQRDDGAVIRFRIDGSSSSDHTIVFVNEILTNIDLWDPVVSRWTQQRPRSRIIRYGMKHLLYILIEDDLLLNKCDSDQRGYSQESLGNPTKISLALLADDLHALLAHLSIERVYAIIGLGLGASVALTYFAHTASTPIVSISAFVGISFPIPASSSTSEQEVQDKWDARVALAQRVGMGITGDKAVARWFSADARNSAEWQRIYKIVASSSLEGMRRASSAAVESVAPKDGSPSVRTGLKNLDIPSLFLSGAGDNMFPEEMEEYPKLMNGHLGAFKLISQTARLACCERADVFVQVVRTWLDQLPV